MPVSPGRFDNKTKAKLVSEAPSKERKRWEKIQRASCPKKKSDVKQIEVMRWGDKPGNEWTDCKQTLQLKS